MPAPTIENLAPPMTAKEFTASFYDGLAATGVSLTTWKPGGVSRTIIAIVAVVLAALSSLITGLARSGFRGLAAGLWARLVARYNFNVEAQDATFATGPVLVSNSSGTPHTFNPGELELSSSTTRKSYKNTSLVTIPAGSTDVVVAMQAVEVGAASSALVGEIDKVVTPGAGLSCRNVEVLASADDESTAELDARCMAKLAPYSPEGPSQAYSVAARGAKRANGSSVGINRIFANPLPNARVDVYVATPSGGVPGTIGDLNTDLGLVDEEIQTKAVPLGVTCDVYSAVEKPVSVDATVWTYNTTGLTAAGVELAIREALAAYFQSPVTAPIGGSQGFVWPEDLRAAIMRATSNGAPIRAFRAAVTPSTPTAIAPNEVPVLGAVTVKVIRVAPPQGAL